MRGAEAVIYGRDYTTFTLPIRGIGRGMGGGVAWLIAYGHQSSHLAFDCECYNP
jgi:hypothetical protein